MRLSLPTWRSVPFLFFAMLVAASCSIDTGLDSFDGFTRPSTACASCVDVAVVRISPAQSTLLVGRDAPALGRAGRCRQCGCKRTGRYLEHFG